MDNLTKEQRKRNMQNIRSKGTNPERMVMRELRRRNIYFAKHSPTITGKPDIVFRKKKVVVFIDSDFWHRHPVCFVMPKTNRKYWKEKINKNQQRDRKVSKRLRREGWKIIRIWECDIKKNLGKCLQKILTEINRV